MEQVAGPCAIELKGIGLIEVAFLNIFAQHSGFDSSEFPISKGGQLVATNLFGTCYSQNMCLLLQGLDR